ncbi:MAG: hypothetical protein AAF664_00210 [Planctomycetota bacterium]
MPSQCSSTRCLRTIALVLIAIGQSAVVFACPFCTAVSQTIRQEMEVMDTVAIGTSIGGIADRNEDTGEVAMTIEQVFKGRDFVRTGDTVQAVYFGDVAPGRVFLLSGVDPSELQWSCLPLANEKAIDYVKTVAELRDADPVERLKYHMAYLNDEDTMLARDSYDEFAVASYEAVQDLREYMDHDQLVGWLQEPDLATDRKRLYLTMLGVCGSRDDLPMLEAMLRSTKKSTRGGLDALIACYMTLAGESGLSLIDELFIENRKAAYADTYAAIMAIRFHGTEGDVIPRSAMLPLLHGVLLREDLADLVIPDLARWQDWSQIDRLVTMFEEADPQDNFVRVPVVLYLKACPLPKAKEAIEKLTEIDPDSIRRASTFFSIPTPDPEVTPTDASVIRPKTVMLASTNHDLAIDSARMLANSVIVNPTRGAIAGQGAVVPNPVTWLAVMVMAVFSCGLAMFLVLTGGQTGTHRGLIPVTIQPQTTPHERFRHDD